MQRLTLSNRNSQRRHQALVPPAWTSLQLRRNAIPSCSAQVPAPGAQVWLSRRNSYRLLPGRSTHPPPRSAHPTGRGNSTKSRDAQQPPAFRYHRKGRSAASAHPTNFAHTTSSVYRSTCRTAHTHPPLQHQDAYTVSPEQSEFPGGLPCSRLPCSLGSASGSKTRFSVFAG